MGYMCLQFASTMASFCTLVCSGGTDPSCADGFPGPGVAHCFPVKVNEVTQNFCLITCGEQFMLPPTCPVGMTCVDQLSSTGAPDGYLDTCSP